MLGRYVFNVHQKRQVDEDTTENCVSICSFQDTIKNDKLAINRADSEFRLYYNSAKVGDYISAKLELNNRIVKNYPEVVKQ